VSGDDEVLEESAPGVPAVSGDETSDPGQDVAGATGDQREELAPRREPAAAVTADELEAYLARARDPALVPGIYNYCLRRCGRCALSGRCLLYRENQEDARRDGDTAESVAANLRLTIDLMRAWCEREGVDPAEVFDESMSDAEVAAEESFDRSLAAAARDPLSIAARDYESAAYAVVDPLRELAPFHDWPPDVADALDTISWNAGAIGTKLSRAVAGRAESADDSDRDETDSNGEWDDDPIQNDWNGSAKVARLAIAESIVAWEVLFVAGETPYDAPIRQRRRELELLDDEIERRFPQAMAFARPGFDQPEVDAAVVNSTTPLQPRRLTLAQRIRQWLAASFRGRT
jgi:hypothetical protein